MSSYDGREGKWGLVVTLGERVALLVLLFCLLCCHYFLSFRTGLIFWKLYTDVRKTKEKNKKSYNANVGCFGKEI